MSKDIIVLTPNGRRQKIHCTPDTSILQVLEDVCEKQGFQPASYDLKHHHHILDLTTTIRFSNLPNKATLEMVESERQRTESNVTIGLLLEDGERRTAEFPPNTSLYDLVTSMAPIEFSTFTQPTILYMRQEVIGASALREKTLRQLGLIGGKAILRLLNKADGVNKQANVSSVYRRSQIEKPACSEEVSAPGPSNTPMKMHYKTYDPIMLVKEERKSPSREVQCAPETTEKTDSAPPVLTGTNQTMINETLMEVEQNETAAKNTASNTSIISQENLERRLKIEDEVTFLGAQKAVAYMQPDDMEEVLDDLPDDFYDLTIEEVRKLYKDLQQNRLQLENTPLLPSAKREDIEKQTSLQRLSRYKHVVVRIQFPDHMILQGIFAPTDTIHDVTNFIKEYLQSSEKPFHIFTSPLKETLEPTLTLLEAKLVPCALMHFKWLDEDGGQPCLKTEVYSKRTSSDAASILASKYRAPCRKKLDDASDTSQISNKASTSGAAPAGRGRELPRWFK